MKKVKPNSRFIYQKQIVKDLDLAQSISSIDIAVQNSTKLQLANHQLIICFHQSPKSDGFQDSAIEIGREVLGYDTEVLAAFHFKDFQSVEVNLSPIELHTHWDEFFNQASEIVLEENNWRLIIEDDFSHSYIEVKQTL